MKLAYVIAYVSNVRDSIKFFEKAFGFKERFIGDDYAELATGSTTLAFASHERGDENLPSGYIAANKSDKPLGIEIAFEVGSVEESYETAISCGAESLKKPSEMPWGQTVAYIRCPDGILIELCSPMKE
ncbi:MAG: VOC family protein [Holosporales bacterium]|jgi:catechol 2,3-dioxygenase-like lactoylglutathione lyase family enzyme|nr:VOC family protein [Holosporales bacterium]